MDESLRVRHTKMITVTGADGLDRRFELAELLDLERPLARCWTRATRRLAHADPPCRGSWAAACSHWG